MDKDKDFFFVPHSYHVDQFTFHINYRASLITTHDDFDSADPSSMQDACHMNLVNWPCSPSVFLAQSIERSPSVQEVMDSIPVGDWDFFFVPRLCHVDKFTFYI